MGFFGIIVTIVFTLRLLSERFEAPQITLNVIQTVVFAAVTLFIASVFVRLTSKPVHSLLSDADTEARLILAKLYSAVIYLIALVIILIRLGVNAGNITIFLGFVATGFAFSIRNVITGYLAWFILLTKKPFRIGDTIEIDGILGRVQHIWTFYVILDETPKSRSDYRKIPNALFLQKPMRNYERSRIPATFEVHVQKAPSSFSKKKADLEAELSTLDAVVSMSAIEGSLTVTCEYTHTLEEQHEAKHRVAEAAARTFNVTQA